MQQDQRIGLALGVLLLGAAAAFFFRNDPAPSNSPRLKSGRELDARIAEKAISPYLEAGDEDHESPGIAARQISDRPGADGGPRLVAPDFSSGDQTVDNDSDVQELAPIPFPDDHRVDAASDERAGSPSAGERIHVVQKGETLSSIAAKELGSSSRYHELFDANRDQLNDADDVRVGMSLRVPSRRTGRTESQTSRTQSNSAPPLLPSQSGSGESTVPGNDPGSSSSKKKFEPAKRPPTGIRGLGSQNNDSEPAAKPTRKLSQLPPRDGKVAR